MYTIRNHTVLKKLVLMLQAFAKTRSRYTEEFSQTEVFFNSQKKYNFHQNFRHTSEIVQCGQCNSTNKTTFVMQNFTITINTSK